MRIRNTLLVHPARSIRALIKKYVFAELSDIEFMEADSGESALAEMNIHSFDMIIISNAMPDISADVFRDRAAETNHNAATPMVVLAEEENGDGQKLLQQQGFEHIVQIRVRPSDLIKKINEVCNPRDWRKDKRYYIPQTKVAVYTADAPAEEGSLINLSRGGALVELISYDPCLIMRPDIALTLRIPGPSECYKIPDIPCRLSRVSVTEWQPSNSPAVMRVIFVFLELSDVQREMIEQVLRLAVEDKLQEDEMI